MAIDKTRLYLSRHVGEFLTQVAQIMGGLALVSGVTFGLLRWMEWNPVSHEVRFGRSSGGIRLTEGDPREPAPLVLSELNDGATFDLHRFLGRRPVVLVFGSYSCPYLRRHLQTLNELYDEYFDRIEFRLVYTREAHPAFEQLPENVRDGVHLKRPSAFAERASNARIMRDEVGLRIPIVVDEMDDRGSKSYAAQPIRFCTVGRNGLIDFVGDTSCSPQRLAEVVEELANNSRPRESTLRVSPQGS